ncbi:MAG TPA: hypothetical protein VJ063_19935 [Verrucomicrobiae bacterium]|nr:hypothetical protein [Verrucomicrobiae bacterium]
MRRFQVDRCRANYCFGVCEGCCELLLSLCELLLPLCEPDCEPVPPCELLLDEFVWFVWLLLLGVLMLPLELLPESRCIEPLELLDPELVPPWSRF